MSRSAIPARFSACRTEAICRAFCSSAAVAVGAVVTTPALIRAMSGTRLTSPVATTSRRVPLTDRRRRVWADAWSGRRRSASKAASFRIGYRMGSSQSEAAASGPTRQRSLLNAHKRTGPCILPVEVPDCGLTRRFSWEFAGMTNLRPALSAPIAPLRRRRPLRTPGIGGGTHPPPRRASIDGEPDSLKGPKSQKGPPLPAGFFFALHRRNHAMSTQPKFIAPDPRSDRLRSGARPLSTPANR
jgi:hypothetical protein